MDLSSWRSPALRRGRSKNNEALIVHQFGDRDRPLSSFEMHSSQDAFVCSYLDGTYQSFLMKLDFSMKKSPSFQAKSSFLLESAATVSASWERNVLVLGATNGCAYVHTVDPLDFSSSEESHSGRYSHALADATSNNSKDWTDGPYCSRIRAVKMHPRDSTAFLSCENSNVHSWKVEVTAKPAASHKMPKVVFALDWSRQVEHQFCVAGDEGFVRVLDYRLMGRPSIHLGALDIPHAHKGAVRDVKWSPFLPNWLATAGEDASVRVWDIRNISGPVIELDLHENTVTSICWSPSNCELLASGGHDCTWRLWALNLPPYYLLASAPPSQAPIAGVRYSPNTSHHCVAATAAGELFCYGTTSRLVSPIVQHRVPEGPDERAIEDLLHFRDFAQAFDSACTLAAKNLAKTPPRVDVSLALLDACSSLSASSVDDKAPFDAQLATFSYFIPPSFPSKLASQVDPKVLRQLDSLRTQVRTLNAAASAPDSMLDELQKSVVEKLSQDLDAFDVPKLCQIVQSLCGRNRALGAGLAASIGQLFDAHHRFQAFIPIAQIALSPTIYDPDPSAAAGNRVIAPPLEQIYKEPQKVFGQLQCLRALLEANSNAADVISAMDSQPPGTAGANHICMVGATTYWAALLSARSFEKISRVLSATYKNVKTFPFGAKVMQFLTEQVLPCLSDRVSEALGSRKKLDPKAERDSAGEKDKDKGKGNAKDAVGSMRLVCSTAIAVIACAFFCAGMLTPQQHDALIDDFRLLSGEVEMLASALSQLVPQEKGRTGRSNAATSLDPASKVSPTEVTRVAHDASEAVSRLRVKDDYKYFADIKEFLQKLQEIENSFKRSSE